jgi:chromosome segregation ATPase
MGMTNGTTICSKHDNIMRLAEKIKDATEEVVSPSELSARMIKIFDAADEIYDFAFTAKEDGQSMENGLGSKNNQIGELYDTNADLKEEIEDLEAEIESLNSEVADLRSQAHLFALSSHN